MLTRKIISCVIFNRSTLKNAWTSCIRLFYIACSRSRRVSFKDCLVLGVHETEENLKLFTKNFWLWIKQNKDSWDYYLTQLKIISLCFYFIVCFFLSMHLRKFFLMQWGEKANFKQIITARIHQNNVKYSSIDCVTWKALILTNWDYFPEIINQQEFAYSVFIKLPRIISSLLFTKFIQTQKKVSYLPWQNNYSNLKTTYIKRKIFLWIKLLEN